MDFLSLAKKRYSLRKFDQKQVEEEKINKIIEAGYIAPTAHNYQPQKIYILKTQKSLDKIRELTSHTFNAPLVLLVGYDINLAWKNNYIENKDSGIMDVSIVTTHMMLEACDLGLESLWALSFDPRQIEKAFDIEDNIKIECILSIGYPREEAKPSRLHEAYRDLSEIIEEL